MAKTKKRAYNLIEIGNMTLMSDESNMRELLKVADRILTKHKQLIQKEKEAYMPPDMFG